MQQFEALQLHALDANGGLHFLEAKFAGNELLAEFLLSRFWPEFRPAVKLNDIEKVK